MTILGAGRRNGVDLNRLSRRELAHWLPGSLNSAITIPSNTWTRMLPSSAASTPNSVPLSTKRALAVSITNPAGARDPNRSPSGIKEPAVLIHRLEPCRASSKTTAPLRKATSAYPTLKTTGLAGTASPTLSPTRVTHSARKSPRIFATGPPAGTDPLGPAFQKATRTISTAPTIATAPATTYSNANRDADFPPSNESSPSPFFGSIRRGTAPERAPGLCESSTSRHALPGRCGSKSGPPDRVAATPPNGQLRRLIVPYRAESISTCNCR